MPTLRFDTDQGRLTHTQVKKVLEAMVADLTTARTAVERLVGTAWEAPAAAEFQQGMMTWQQGFSQSLEHMTSLNQRLEAEIQEWEDAAAQFGEGSGSRSEIISDFVPVPLPRDYYSTPGTLDTSQIPKKMPDLEHFKDTAAVFSIPPELLAATVGYEMSEHNLLDKIQDNSIPFFDPTLGPAQMRMSTAKTVVDYIEKDSSQFDLDKLEELGYTENPSDKQLRKMILDPATATILAAGYLSYLRDYRVDNQGNYPDSFANKLTVDQQLILYSHYSAGEGFSGWDQATEAGSVTKDRLWKEGWLPYYQQQFNNTQPNL